MKQRYIYIILYGEGIEAIETRRARAYNLCEELKRTHEDRPTIGNEENALELYMTDCQTWEAMWRVERYPIGPPIPTDKDKQQGQQEPSRNPAGTQPTPSRNHPPCATCTHKSAGGSDWCTLHLCRTPRPRCADYTPAAEEPAAPDGERDSATRRAQ